METALHALDGLDSLRLLERVALAEEHFGVMVDTGGLGQMETLGDIVRLVAAGRPA
jgi:acyl carrier protein